MAGVCACPRAAADSSACAPNREQACDVLDDPGRRQHVEHDHGHRFSVRYSTGNTGPHLWLRGAEALTETRHGDRWRHLEWDRAGPRHPRDSWSVTARHVARNAGGGDRLAVENLPPETASVAGGPPCPAASRIEQAEG